MDITLCIIPVFIRLKVIKVKVPSIGKKALNALPGYMVISDEQQHFEWVGAHGASTSIIILIHGENDDGVKVGACGHLNVESPYSVNRMLSKMNIDKICSVHLISGDTQENDPLVRTILDILEEKEVINIDLCLGRGISQGAMNVKMGEVTYGTFFTLQNAGITDLIELNCYALQAQINILSNLDTPGKRPFLSLGVDARLPEHSKRVIDLLGNTTSPFLDSDAIYMYKSEDEPSIFSIFVKLILCLLAWGWSLFISSISNFSLFSIMPKLLLPSSPDVAPTDENKILTDPVPEKNSSSPLVSNDGITLFSETQSSQSIDPSTSETTLQNSF